MASINYLLFAVLIITPFVENAPSTQKTSSADELHTRLVFVDDTDNAINSNSPAGSITPTFRSYGTPIVSAARAAHVAKVTPYAEEQGPTKMLDERQNWGIIAEESVELPDDDSYYNRPLSIPRNVNTRVFGPEKKTKVVKPEVSNPVAKPSACDVAIVSCCGLHSRVYECFRSRKCFNINENMLSNVCSPTSVNKTIDAISKYYRG